MSLEASIAVNRFGLGATRGEISAAEHNPQEYLLSQLRSPELISDSILPTTVDALTAFKDFRRQRKEFKKMKLQMSEDTGSSLRANERVPNIGTEIYNAEVRARLNTIAKTETPFAERLCLFWTNHFAISAIMSKIASMSGAFEREAIRPNVTGNFFDLLLASTQHPAMLFYLDNVSSFGPNSRAGQKRNKGLNENLAREILELHTVGVDGGYSLDDIQELAKAITGWSVVKPDRVRANRNGFIFRRSAHEGGDRIVLGKQYKNTRSEEMGRQILLDLANHPATARHIATKLARYFVSDNPPESMVADMENAFLKSKGELVPVYHSMLSHKDAFSENMGKFKSPLDLLASIMRGFDIVKNFEIFQDGLAIMGQKMWSPPSPKGWPDEKIHWATSDGLKTRLDFAVHFSKQIPVNFDVNEMASQVLGQTLRDETQTAIRRAADQSQALAILVMSPEFQNR